MFREMTALSICPVARFTTIPLITVVAFISRHPAKQLLFPAAPFIPIQRLNPVVVSVIREQPV